MKECKRCKELEGQLDDLREMIFSSLYNKEIIVLRTQLGEMQRKLDKNVREAGTKCFGGGIEGI